jgi:hypothetical protein
MTKNREQLLIVESANTAGCVTYFRISSEVKLDTLAAAWLAAGLAAEALPTPVKDEVALGRAVNDQAEKRRLVRPLARRGAWAIVDETVVQGQSPTYRTMQIVEFVQGCPTWRCVDATVSEHVVIMNAISTAFHSHCNTLAHHDISSWLLDIAAGLGAVSLRESGGVYFIPRAGVERWNKIAGAVEAGGAGTVFRIPAMRTAEAVAAITDAITAEAAGLSQAMEDELMATGDDALGKRALNTRAGTAIELLAKLSTYEDLLGRQLDIRNRVEQLSANITAAVITAQMSGESEAA